MSNLKRLVKDISHTHEKATNKYLFERDKLLHFDALAKHAELVRRPRLAELVSHVVAGLQQALHEGVIGYGAARRIQFENALGVRANGL